MSLTHFFTIINGAAGGGRCRARVDRTLQTLQQAGFTLEAHLTEGAGHATELARDAYEDGERHFLLIGGDGTTYEVINGLLPQRRARHSKDKQKSDEDKLTVGLLPLGTGNSFLRDFDIIEESQAHQALLRGTTRAVDVLRVTHREGTLYALNSVSLGFMPRAGILKTTHFHKLGAAGYAAAVLASLVRLDTEVFPLRCNGNSNDTERDCRPAVSLSFLNSKYVGGSMMMAPSADTQDGKVHIIRIGDINRRELIRAFPSIYDGTHIAHPAVEARKAARVTFLDEREQDVLIDGEQTRLALRSIDVLPQALELML